MKKEFASTPRMAVDCAAGLITTPYKEHLIGLYLNARNQVIYKEVVSLGDLTSSLVHPREVFFPAIKKHAHAVIVLHNHPSGDVEPSDDDLRVHKRLVDAGNLLGVEVMDGLIFSKDGKFHSLKENI